MVSIPSMKTWVDGETVTPQDMNEQIRDVGNFLIEGAPAARVAQRLANQTIASSVGTAVQFDTVEYDRDGMWNPAVPDRLTIQTSGIYSIAAQVCWQVANAGNLRTMTIEGATGVLNQTRLTFDTTHVPWGINFMTLSTIAYLPSGSIVRVSCQHNEPATFGTAASTGGDYSALSLIWLGS